jgi:hypothetical protein
MLTESYLKSVTMEVSQMDRVDIMAVMSSAE